MLVNNFYANCFVPGFFKEYSFDYKLRWTINKTCNKIMTNKMGTLENGQTWCEKEWQSKQKVCLLCHLLETILKFYRTYLIVE